MTATGSEDATSGVVRSGLTDSGGCVIFGSLPVGSYSVSTALAGYLDSAGNATPTSSITTTPGSSTNLTVRLGQPGKISATFTGIRNSTINVPARAPAISWINPNMSIAGILDPSTNENTSLTTGQTIFPFITTDPTTFTNNYTVYAGRCASAMPPSATLPAPTNNQQSYATVPPAGAATSTSNGLVTVKMPIINLTVTYNGGAVKPAHVTLDRFVRRHLEPDDRVALDQALDRLARFPGPAVRRRLHGLRRLRRSRSHRLSQAHRNRQQHELHREQRQRRHHRDPEQHELDLSGTVLMRARSALKRLAREESGMTIVELLTVMIIAIITSIALFSFQDLVLRQSNRVFARVDATQDARTAMEKIQTRLHSACIAEDVIPIRVGSDANNLKFISKYGSAADGCPGDARDLALRHHPDRHDVRACERVQPRHLAVLVDRDDEPAAAAAP